MTLRQFTVKEWVLRSTGGQELAIRLHAGESAAVGRDLSSDIPILDAGVSRHHATIRLEDDELWIEDLHSQNGTLVNTESVRLARIHSGDIITFGRISFTLTARTARDDAADPLERLSREALARLLHVSRELGSGRDRELVFQVLIRLAVKELAAERGVILLWEPERRLFHPVAACPPDLLGDAFHLVSRTTAESILHAGKPRLLEPGGETDGPLAARRSALAAARSALAAPLPQGRPAGIIYIDRASEAGFLQPDVEFLLALAWVAAPALETSSQLADMRAWNERLEGLVAERTRELEESRSGRKEEEPHDGSPRLLRDLEEHLERELKSLAEHGPGEAPGEAAVRAIEDAWVILSGIRRLQDRRSARVEEVQVAHALSEVFEREMRDASLRIEDGCELSVLCAPDELLAALRLARSCLLLARAPAGESSLGRSAPNRESSPGRSAPNPDAGGEVPGGSCPITARASGSEDGRWVEIHLSAGEDGGHPGRSDPALFTPILRRLVTERLRGTLEGASGGSHLKIRLVNAAAALRETLVLRAAMESASGA